MFKSNSKCKVIGFEANLISKTSANSHSSKMHEFLKTVKFVFWKSLDGAQV